MHFDLSVVIPAYNEEARIEPTLRALDDFLSRTDLRYEIVVVDDGSSDGTVDLVTSLSRHIRATRCIATTPNRGKGHAVRIGMLASLGRVRVMYDADGSISAEQIPGLLEHIHRHGADVAIGSRYTDGARTDVRQPFYRRWWSRVANQVVQRALVGGIRDTQCGFKAFTADAADVIFGLTRIDGWAFDLEVLALANRLGYRVKEVGITWSDDARSRINPLRDAYNVFNELLLIRGNLRQGVYGDLQAKRLTLSTALETDKVPLRVRSAA